MNNYVFRFLVIAILLAVAPSVLLAQQSPEVAGVADLLAMREPAADFRFQYGQDPLQFADLQLNSGEGPFSVVAPVHGGCGLAEYDVRHLGAMAEALTDSGVVTWTLELQDWQRRRRLAVLRGN